MRKCNQKNCAFLKLGVGCRKCGDCSAHPFIIADDCIRCLNCENILNSCRWGDEKVDFEQVETEENKPEENKPMEIKAK